MAFVGDVPWHGLGRRVDSSVTAIEMCKKAGLQWKVSKVPAPGARIVENPDDENVYDRYLILREPIENEDGSVALGMVGSTYKPLQNSEAFAFFEPFIQDRYASFHTAGALGNGERIWVLSKLNDCIVVNKDDVVDRFLLLSNSHDGRSSVSVRFTPIRVVCQNTLNLALSSGSGVITVRHTRNMPNRLAKAQSEELKHVFENVYSEAASLFRSMAQLNLSTRRVNRVLELVFPRTEKQKGDRVRPVRWERIEHILEDSSVTPSGSKGTLWALYNAITRDEDYRASPRNLPEARLSRIWFGSGHDVKTRAFKICCDELRKAA